MKNDIFKNKVDLYKTAKALPREIIPILPSFPETDYQENFK